MSGAEIAGPVVEMARRRGHQARSHWYHQRTRLARRVEITLVRP
jgi:hypothetical protein